MKSLYALLLHLFPRSYREEYGDEMQAVFELALEDAIKKGSLALVQLWLRELTGLPRAILFQHLRERRKAMLDRLGSYFEFSYGSWKEFFTALFPFLYVGCIWPVTNMLVHSNSLATGILVSLFVLFSILFFVAARRGMPRWSFPYLGFVFSLLSVYFFSGILGLFIILPFRKLYDRVGFLGDLAYSGLFWFGLLLAMVFLVVMTRFSPIFQRLGRDWTLLCFIVYGATPFAVTLSFDEYAHDEPFILLTFLILALGAWFYLREDNKWKRFWTLFTCLGISMFIVAAGKTILLPTQNWPISISPALVTSEAKQTLLTWVWLALGMLVPLALEFLPHRGGLSQASLSEV